MPSSNQSKKNAIKAAQERIRSNMPNVEDIEQWARNIIDGKVESLARAITLIESNKPEDRPQAHQLLLKVKELQPENCTSIRLGITGIPGVGKSTFIERLGIDLISEGYKVAVLAVDPSSQRTGGSILGDKTRMEKLSISDNAFVRPSPAADALGGVARATMEAILLCEAAGYNRIIVETVGVGQSETSVRDMVDVFGLLLIAGAGDEVQGIKRGIVEMADLVVVHKADGDQTTKCKDTASAYRSSLHLFPQPNGRHNVEVITASSTTGDGHEDFKSKISSLIDLWMENGFFETQRSTQRVHRMKMHARDLVMDNTLTSKESKTLWNSISQRVKKGDLSAFSAAWQWVNSTSS